MGRTVEDSLQFLPDLFAHFLRDVVVLAGVDRRTGTGIGQSNNRIFLIDRDLDQRCSVFRKRPALRDDHCHGIADAGHTSIGQNRHRRLDRAEKEVHHLDRNIREVGLRVDSVNARDLQRRRGVDSGDAAACHRGAGEGAMQHAGQADIVDKLPPSGQQASVFLAWCAFANVAVRAGDKDVHAASP